MRLSSSSLPNALVTREFPLARYEFLRFQIGRLEWRLAQEPVYPDDTSKKVCGHTPGPESVEVFRLAGYGPTLAAALERAANQL